MVSSVGDRRRVCYELVLGRLKSSPFPLEAVDRCAAIRGLLGVTDSALEVPQGQPFHLHLVSRVLKVVGDPDTAILVDGNDTFATGVPIGVDEPLPRTPMVFPPQERHRKLDESDFNPIAENYASAQLSKEELEAKFREEESLGRMVPSKLSVLHSEYGDRLRVASMGAITKPDGGIRPLHDGAHSIRVNNDIIYTGIVSNVLGLPKWPQWCVNVLSRGRLLLQWQQTSSLHRDFSKSGRKIGAYTCVVVQTLFQMSSGATRSVCLGSHRPFVLIGRFVSYIELFYHMVYVDDLSGAFLGDRKFLNLLIWSLEPLLGTISFLVDFVGYQLHYDACQVGISDRRGRWLLEWIDRAQADSFVVVSRDS